MDSLNVNEGNIKKIVAKKNEIVSTFINTTYAALATIVGGHTTTIGSHTTTIGSHTTTIGSHTTSIGTLNTLTAPLSTLKTFYIPAASWADVSGTYKVTLTLTGAASTDTWVEIFTTNAFTAIVAGTNQIVVSATSVAPTVPVVLQVYRSATA